MALPDRFVISFIKSSLNLDMELPSSFNNKALFILNPYAGIPPVKIIISKLLQRRKDEIACYKSLSIDESGSMIKQNFSKYDVFVAAGGDGTVRTVASELIGSDKLLGVLPIGSGNGFAKELGFKPILRSLLKDISRRESLTIDVIEINNNLCLNVAGIGLDSFVAHSFDKFGPRGFWSYAVLTMINFFRLKPFRIKIICQEKIMADEEVFVLTIANTRQFGRNAFIAPGASPNDGMMDIVLLKPFPKILFPVFIVRLFTKKMNGSKYVQYLKTDKEIIIRTSESRFHIDGEPVFINGDIVVKVKKEALKVLKTRYYKPRTG